MTDMKMKEMQVRASIHNQLVESGEKERLKEMLRSKLVECGWRNDVRERCKEIISEKGAENIKADELINEITNEGRKMVPAAVKAELLQEIRQFLSN
eukprot:CAMPEP_0201536574 /NCGR_PEP_ID=MMETSP0161_2-20130828/62223_1 /ASSEMBLY_ACC=CAM_ASM_000251 /TAXON_ID=180227 /ORGANISM="Neoparamoeba aestuarina, Strain SoJaBio B1-5/56/2" /LENGTH=96 /DNA_ID=CAMNT_0047942353 /DNA_START=143 /DNA_END=430 /DNA_ORIENTATION=-